MNTRFAVFLISALVWASCASGNQEKYAELSPAQLAAVKISKAEPTDCGEEIGPIEVRRFTPFRTAKYEDAIDELRQEAAVRKGNYVVLDVVRQDNPATISLGGRLFLCDSKPANLAQASTSSSSSACEPDCSPGYVCLRGQCVSACNPPCEKTERCGEDRLCRPKP